MDGAGALGQKRQLFREPGVFRAKGEGVLIEQASACQLGSLEHGADFEPWRALLDVVERHAADADAVGQVLGGHTAPYPSDPDQFAQNR